jgi:hypothetical protein
MNIAINQLNVLGYELFDDSESFLNELNSQEIQSLQGGFFSSFGFGFNSKFGSYNDYYSYGSYGGYSGYSGYGFGHNYYC